MKKGLVVIGVLSLAVAGYGQDFVVRGKLSAIKQPIDVIFQYRGQEQKYVSTDGTFEFKVAGQPSDATIKTLPHHPTLTMADTAYWKFMAANQQVWGIKNFFLDGDINIIGKKLEDAKVEGSKEQIIYQAFRAKQQAIDRSLDSVKKVKGATAKKSPSSAEQKLLKEKEDIKLRFVEHYPDSYFSLNLAREESMNNVVTFNRMLDLLSERLRKTSTYAGLKSMSEGYNMKKIGNIAKEFTLNTAEGTPVSLASYRGKYVLVDFWASWCEPCRAENPNVVRAYNKFNGKNFEVLSVSLDAQKDNWLKSVKEDKLPWTQVLDLQGNNSTAIAYAVTGIPDNVLIDPKGIIIAHNLRGEALEKALEKLVK